MQITRLQIQVGCIQGTANTCSIACPKGAFSCNELESYICEYGYFMNNKQCIQCPEQIDDPLKLYCMDCVENPYSWANNRSCTYDYIVGDYNNPQGTFLKIVRPQLSLYLLQGNILNVCFGCTALTIVTNTSQANIVDDTFNFVTCLAGFYFLNGYCQSCGSNCLICLFGEYCIACPNEYYLFKTTCIQCPANCVQCQFNTYVAQKNYDSDSISSETTLNKLNCLQCTSPFVVSQDQTQCISCGPYCFRCEQEQLVKDKISYILRCRQCVDYYILDPNGYSCIQAKIPNCLQTYFQILDTYGIRNTYDISFIPASSTSSIQQLCRQCKQPQILSADSTQCINQGYSVNCLSMQYLKDNTIICLKCMEVPLYNSQCQNYGFKMRCNDLISQCNNCAQVSNKENQITYCYSCGTGSYVDFFNNICTSCPNGCSLCYQYSSTYNFTAYLQTMPYMKIGDRLEFRTETILVGCSICSNGFILIDGQCQGCDPSCVNEDGSSACIVLQGKAFCSACNTRLQRSITNDLSQCQECPNHCLACTDRVKNINSYFQGQYSALMRYSRLCYLTEYLDSYNSQLGLPIICDPTNSQTGKCKNVANMDITLYCDSQAYLQAVKNLPPQQLNYTFDINSFFQNIKNGFSTIQFATIENVALVNLLNDDVYEELNIVIELIADEQNQCNIPYNTQILFKFQENVYTLLKENITITSSTYAQVNLGGNFLFQNYQYLNFVNVVLNLYQLASQININGSQPTSLSFIQCQILSIWISHAVSFINIGNLTLINVIFESISVNDTDAPFYLPSQSGQIIIINNVTFTNIKLTQSVLFPIINAQNTEISINHLNIQYSELNDSSIFKDKQFNESVIQGVISIHHLNIKYCNLGNATIFNFTIMQKIIIREISVTSTTLNASIILVANTVNISEITIQYNQILQSSTIIYALLFKSVFYLQKGYFSENNCLAGNCLIACEGSQKEDIHLSQVYLNQIALKQATLNISFTTNSALIYFVVIQKITMYDIQIDNIIGFPIFYLNTFNQLNITKFSYNWSLQTDNKLIPGSQECLKFKFENKQYNYYGLYISNFVTSIYFEKFVLQNLLSVDDTFIYIKSYDILEKLTSNSGFEQIKMIDFHIQNTNLVIYSMNNFVSNIMIDSRQKQNITIKNFTFVDNHLIQLQDGTVTAAAVGLLIRTNLANLTMSNIRCYGNRATNTQLGVFYLFSTNIYMDNIFFQDTNVYDPSWNSRFQTKTMDPSFFEIKSGGGNIIMVCTNLVLNNSNFINTISSQAGINLNFNLNLTAVIYNTQFIGQYTSFSEFSSGGALYINCDGGFLNLVIFNSSFEDCVAVQYGGAIYVNPPVSHTSNITIHKTQFIKCQAYFGIITVIFQSTALDSQMLITQSTFCNNGIDHLLSNMQVLSVGQQSMISTSGTIIYQEHGCLIVSDCNFRNSSLISIIKVIQISKLKITQSTFSFNRIFDSPLILITSNTGSSIQFNDVMFVENSIFQQVSNVLNPQNSSINFNNSNLAAYNTCFPVNFLSFNNSQPVQEPKSRPQFQYPQSSDWISLGLITKYFDWDNNDTTLITILLMNYKYTVDSLVSIQLQFSSRLELTRLSIDKNQCLKCQSGFISIKSIQSIVIQISEMVCVNNQLGYYGCVYLAQGSTLQTVSNQFPLFLRALQSIDYGSINISSSIFESNIASYGTGISAFDVQVYVINSQFIKNEARYIGGSIYFQASITQLILDQNLIIQNIAQVAPAIFARNLNIPMNNNLIIDNWSSKQIAQNEDQPTRLTIRMVNNTQFQLVSDNFYYDEVDVRATTGVQTPHNIIYLPSGQQISQYSRYFEETQEDIPSEWIFRVLNLNQKQKIIATGSSTDYCSLSARKQSWSNYSDSLPFNVNYTNPDMVQFNESLGMYDLDQMVITFDPYQDDNLYLELQIKCTSVKTANNTNYALYLNVKTLPCQIGEAYSQQQCVQCSPGTYSVDPTNRICLNKDQISMINVTSTRINVSPDYYRYSQSTSFTEWCVNLPKNCKGGWDAGDKSCFLGHSGALCESCDIYAIKTAEPYAYAGDYACAPCSEVAKYNTLVIVLISLFTMGSLVYSVIGNLESMAKFVKRRIKMSLRIQVSSGNMNLILDNTAVLIKLFLNYIQIISALTQFKIQIPIALVSAFQAMGDPLKSMGYSFDCFLVMISSLPIIYMRILWSLVVPISYIVIFLIVYCTLVITSRLNFKIGVVYTTFIYMFIYLQPNYVGSFIQLVSSRFVSTIYWVQADVNYKYYTDTHYTWLLRWVVPNLIGWSLVIPLFLILKLKTIRRDNIQCRIRWGYLYNEYTDGAYLWEFMKMYQKLFVIMSLSYYQDQVIVKGQLIFFIIFIYGIFTYRFTPYTKMNLNQIDRKSTVVCGASMAIGVLIYACQQSTLQYLELMMFFAIIILNLFFLTYMLIAVLQGYINKAQGNLDKLRDKINKRYPRLQHQYRWLRHLLMNRGQMQQRAREQWAQLRFKTRQGIKRHREDKSKPIFDFSQRIENLQSNDHEQIQLIHSSTPIRPEESLSPTIEDNSRQIVRYFNQLINRSPSRKSTN